MRISAQQRQHNETRIRAAMDRLLRGDIPAGGGCDVKTLAREAGVDRTAFYGARPYVHLREEFEQRLQALRDAGEVIDHRTVQITRLKAEVDALKRRLSKRDQTIEALADFKTEALSRLAAQHDGITRLRAAAGTSNVRRLPTRAAKTDRTALTVKQSKLNLSSRQLPVQARGCHGRTAGGQDVWQEILSVAGLLAMAVSTLFDPGTRGGLFTALVDRWADVALERERGENLRQILGQLYKIIMSYRPSRRSLRCRGGIADPPASGGRPALPPWLHDRGSSRRTRPGHGNRESPSARGT
ncbi:MAG TPA: hypothetical protein VFM55_04555 [Micromonosporaceae bacterium]|nr:hypothetical protein [Micromonosporaceae bacterium]